MKETHDQATSPQAESPSSSGPLRRRSHQNLFSHFVQPVESMQSKLCYKGPELKTQLLTRESHFCSLTLRDPPEIKMLNAEKRVVTTNMKWLTFLLQVCLASAACNNAKSPKTHTKELGTADTRGTKECSWTYFSASVNQQRYITKGLMLFA